MLGLVLSFGGRWDEAREELLAAELGEGTSGAPNDAMQTCAVLTEVELARGDLVAARRAFERAGVWGRPTEDDPVGQAVFDATDALLAAATGDLVSAVAIAHRIAAIPVETSGHGMICRAWLLAGEVLARAGATAEARRCFTNMLRHRSGRFPRDRALALAGVAVTLPASAPHHVGADLAAVASAIWTSRGFGTPQWLVAVRPGAAPAHESGLTEDEAVALALAFVET
jgi:hypothetical protein